MPMELVLVGIVCLAIGAFAAILAMRNAKAGSIREAESKVTAAHSEAEQVMADAKRAAETLKKEALLEAKEEIIQNKQAAEAEEAQRKKEIRALENRVMQREESLDAAMRPLISVSTSFPASRVKSTSALVSLRSFMPVRRTSSSASLSSPARTPTPSFSTRFAGEVTHEAATIIRESEPEGQGRVP